MLRCWSSTKSTFVVQIHERRQGGFDGLGAVWRLRCCYAETDVGYCGSTDSAVDSAVGVVLSNVWQRSIAHRADVHRRVIQSARPDGATPP